MSNPKKPKTPPEAEPLPSALHPRSPHEDSEGHESEEALPKESEGEGPEYPTERFILLLRHGIAEERSADKPDGERELTRKGASRMKEIGRGLAEIFPRLDVIYASPLIRSAQTGACLAKGYGEKIPLRLTEALEPGRPETDFRALLASIPGKRVIFVGHEPDLSRTLGRLCGLDTSAMELRKGACYGIQIKETGTMKLEWMLPPSALRRIRK